MRCATGAVTREGGRGQAVQHASRPASSSVCCAESTNARVPECARRLRRVSPSGDDADKTRRTAESAHCNAAERSSAEIDTHTPVVAIFARYEVCTAERRGRKHSRQMTGYRKG